LKRIYVLFFISLESRRIELVACTPNPTGAWVAQQARNLLMALDDRGQPLRFLIHDRDAKFNGGCDHVFLTLATDGNGFRLLGPFSRRAELRPVATGRNHGAT
jgi:putative transposase